MKHKCFTIVCNSFTSLSWKCFYIIINMLCGMIGFIQMKYYTFVWHNINVYKYIIICTAILWHPALTLIICTTIISYDWEIFTNRLPIKCCNRFYNTIRYICNRFSIPNTIYVIPSNFIPTTADFYNINILSPNQYCITTRNLVTTYGLFIRLKII